MKNRFYMIAAITLMSLSCAPAHAVSLKQNSVITDNIITLGDIFYDLPRDEGRVLGAAPRPGQEMVLDARTLLRIALALDLSWRPSNSADYIVLRREASVVEYSQIEEALQTALYDENVHGSYEIDIPEHYREIILPADQPASVEITRFRLDANRESFEATLAAPSAKTPLQQVVISGKISPVISVPVLKNNIQNGSIITPSDISYVKIKEREFTVDMVADADAMTGMTARRIVMAGRPVKNSDLIAPQVVERGALVTLSLKNGIMNITTQAKALENGATGEIIRVVNTASNTMIQARVTGPNTVTVVN